MQKKHVLERPFVPVVALRAVYGGYSLPFDTQKTSNITQLPSSKVQNASVHATLANQLPEEEKSSKTRQSRANTTNARQVPEANDK